jgi:hypothetical protein
LIVTLLITILIEGMIVIAYSIWRRKPPGPILLTSVVANLITQPLLWVGLNIFFQDYLIALFGAEILIWLMEGLLLRYVPANNLRFRDAIFLAFLINVASFALGWLLPV